MIEVVQLETKHLIRFRELFPEDNLSMGPEPDQFLENLSVRKFSFAVLEDGEPIGCGGIIPLWTGVGEAWTNLSQKLLKRPIFISKLVKQKLYELQEKGRFHRIQCGVLYNFQTGCNWARWLGFICEGPMYMYCPNKLNYKRFVLLGNY